MPVAKTVILFPLKLPQISCFTLSLKCFSFDSDSCPTVGIGPLLQFPHLLRAGPVRLTFLFFPLVSSSYWVVHGSIYSFPLVRSSCPLSAGVLHALLCLKVYSWCIRGERCTPCPPTPLPSCFLYSFSSCFITEYWVLLPVLYSRTLLFFHSICNRLYLLIPNSQSIPSLLSFPLGNLSMSVSLFLFCR